MIYFSFIVFGFAIFLPSTFGTPRFNNLSYEDFVYGVGSDVHRYPLMKGSRTWRQGIRAVFALGQNATLNITAEEGLKHNETYLEFADEQGNHRGHLRAAMSFVLAHKAIGPNYKWMLGGDDDTLFYPPNLVRLLSRLNHSMPYFIADDLWFAGLSANRSDSPFSDGRPPHYHHPHAFAPRCLPCHHPHCRNATHADSLPLDCGCPCTPKGACFAETLPLYDGKNKTCEAKARVVAHGGSGFILSVGLMQALNFTVFELCAMRHPGHGDNALSVCLWKQNFAATALSRSHKYFGSAYDPKCKNENVKCRNKLRSLISTHLAARRYKSIEDADEAMVSIYTAFESARNQNFSKR